MAAAAGQRWAETQSTLELSGIQNTKQCYMIMIKHISYWEEMFSVQIMIIFSFCLSG
jgi:hypothetical protein